MHVMEATRFSQLFWPEFVENEGCLFWARDLPLPRLSLATFRFIAYGQVREVFVPCVSSDQTKRADDSHRPLASNPGPGRALRLLLSRALSSRLAELQHAIRCWRWQSFPPLFQQEIYSADEVRGTTVPVPPCAEPPVPASARPPHW